MTVNETARALAQMFEFEYCSECYGDAEDHVMCGGPFGLPFAMCKFTPLTAGWALRNGKLQLLSVRTAVERSRNRNT